MQASPFRMSRVAVEDRGRIVFGPYALELLLENVEGLVPRNPLVARNTTILSVAFTVGIPVDTFEGVFQALLAIGHLACQHSPREAVDA